MVSMMASTALPPSTFVKPAASDTALTNSALFILSLPIGTSAHYLWHMGESTCTRFVSQHFDSLLRDRPASAVNRIAARTLYQPLRVGAIQGVVRVCGTRRKRCPAKICAIFA